MRILPALAVASLLTGCAPKHEACSRGDAVAVLDPGKVSSHVFFPGIGPRAEESATLADGVGVRIAHTGCDHVVERYVFSNLKTPPGAGETYPRMAAELLGALPVRAERAAEKASWVALLTSRAAATPPYAANEPIPVVAGSSVLSIRSKSDEGRDVLVLVFDDAAPRR